MSSLTNNNTGDSRNTGPNSTSTSAHNLLDFNTNTTHRIPSEGGEPIYLTEERTLPSEVSFQTESTGRQTRRSGEPVKDPFLEQRASAAAPLPGHWLTEQILINDDGSEWGTV
jgi:hypothetical protein